MFHGGGPLFTIQVSPSSPSRMIYPCDLWLPSNRLWEGVSFQMSFPIAVLPFIRHQSLNRTSWCSAWWRGEDLPLLPPIGAASQALSWCPKEEGGLRSLSLFLTSLLGFLSHTPWDLGSPISSVGLCPLLQTGIMTSPPRIAVRTKLRESTPSESMQ